jgi:carboxyl-terminal processing protease
MDSPAEKAGLQAEDILLRIGEGNGTSLQGKTLDEVVALLRGEPGTTKKLLVSRKKLGVFTTSVHLLGTTVLPTVTNVGRTTDGIGYLKIRSFVAGQTIPEFEKAIARLRFNGRDPAGLIVDLRDNLGGEMTEATGIASLLLPSGVIIRTWNRKEGTKDIPKQGATILRGTPIVILVNRNSASASEILAAALCERDSPRATCVGEKTYGKGVIQLVTTLPNGDQVKLTTWEFFSTKSGGTAIHGVGITPTVELPMPSDTSQPDRWKQAAILRLRESRR